MKSGKLAIILILICWFLTPPSSLRAEEWYQGHPGQWQRQGNNWQWRSTRGDDWYQGRQGNWYQQQDGWQYYGNNGDEYRQGSNGWQWYNGRQHGAEGSAYHNRAPGDNRTYQQFQEQQGR